MFNTMCPECAEKLGKLYITTPVEGSERWGVCKLCFQHRYLMQYESTPLRRARPKAATGGGERAKAGRG